MSLRDAIQQAVQAGIVALDDLAGRAVYTSKGTPTYSATTGAVGGSSTALANVPMVFASYSKLEIDGEAVMAEDQKAIIAVLDLAATPTKNDVITKADGTVWSVISIKTDPAGAAWVLQVRRP